MLFRSPNCQERADLFHSCKPTSGLFEDKGYSTSDLASASSLTAVVCLAPIMGIALDYFLPIPSSLFNSALLSFLGSTLVGLLWISLGYKGSKNLTFFIKNLKNCFYTPNLSKIFAHGVMKTVTVSWVCSLIASSIFQIFLFTPGNASYLENRIAHHIHKEAGVNLLVSCPRNTFFFYQETLECRVKTGIFGITVPARVELSPILGSSKIAISLI